MCGVHLSFVRCMYGDGIEGDGLFVDRIVVSEEGIAGAGVEDGGRGFPRRESAFRIRIRRRSGLQTSIEIS